MNNLKKRFSPTALAKILSGAMLLHAALAWAGVNCLSVLVYTTNVCGGDNYPVSCSQPAASGSYCAVHLGTGYLWWCCPSGETCGTLDGGSTQCYGWCQCN